MNKVVDGVESCIGSVDRDSFSFSVSLFHSFSPVITMRGSGRAHDNLSLGFHREFTTYHCARVVDSRWQIGGVVDRCTPQRQRGSLSHPGHLRNHLVPPLDLKEGPSRASSSLYHRTSSVYRPYRSPLLGEEDMTLRKEHQFYFVFLKLLLART